jgi:hypothetical protein
MYFLGWIDEDKHQEKNDPEVPFSTASAATDTFP